MDAELLRDLSVITEEEQRILDGNGEIETRRYIKRKDLVVDAEQLTQRGKLIQVRPHTRFVHFPKHRHNYIEVIYMCQGTTTHIIDGHKVLLEEGDLLFLNPHAEQGIFPAKATDIAVNFIILPEFFDTAFSMMGEEENALRDFLIGTLSGNNELSSYLYFHVSDILQVQNLIENMVWTIFYNMGNKRSCNQITMGVLFLQLLNYMDKMEIGSGKFQTELTGAVLGYIEEHYRNGSLSELAELLKYDVYWLSREIKKYTGKTYKELLQEKRMDQARYLLAHTKLSVNQIIALVGYENNSYFYRKFREKYGETPKDYREREKRI